MNERTRRRMYAHDAAQAYLQWFGGLSFPTPEARDEARRGYEGSLRDLRGYWFGRGPGGERMTAAAEEF
jgi:hypothetical protein